MTNIKKNGLLALIAIIPIILVAIFYQALPAQIPHQWQLHGGVRYGDKNIIWLMALIPLFCTILFKALPLFDPRKNNYKKFSTQYDLFLMVFNVFFIILLALIIWESLSPNSVNMMKIIPTLVGVLFMIMGNMMPKFKSNFYMGIKNPWTLSSEEVWNKTHRLAGILWFIGGFMIAIGSFILPEQMLMVFLFVVMLFVVLVPSVSSFVWFKKLGGENHV